MWLHLMVNSKHLTQDLVLWVAPSIPEGSRSIDSTHHGAKLFFKETYAFFWSCEQQSGSLPSCWEISLVGVLVLGVVWEGGGEVGGWLVTSLAPLYWDFSRGFPAVNPMGFQPRHPCQGGELEAMLCGLLLFQAS